MPSSSHGIEPSENVTCTKFSMSEYYNINCVQIVHVTLCVCVCVCVAAAMNQEVLILLGVFVVGAIATLIRAILFNLAGERFVARLRKNVSLCETAKLIF